MLGTRPQSVSSPAGEGAWQVAAQGGAALAAAVGVGRFVYTPLMQAQAGVAAATGGQIATANYLGYLLGALSLGYAAGQVLGPRAVHPLLTGGYTGALLVGAALAAAAGIGSALLRLRFPHGSEAHRGHRRPRHPAPGPAGVPGHRERCGRLVVRRWRRAVPDRSTPGAGLTIRLATAVLRHSPTAHTARPNEDER